MKDARNSAKSTTRTNSSGADVSSGGDVDDLLEQAAREEAASERRRIMDPEPSIGSRLGQIGLLGWMIVVPTLLALWIGRQLDSWLATNILFSAALLMLGACLGLWFAWQWMHRQ